MPGQKQDSYPGLPAIADPGTQTAIRTLYDIARALQDNARGPIVGTISPDTKPKTLKESDQGRLFHATDYDRVFVWGGKKWADAPGQPRRQSIAFFPPTFDPGPGWAQCDGSTTKISTPEGRTETLALPVVGDVNGQSAFMRL